MRLRGPGAAWVALTLLRGVKKCVFCEIVLGEAPSWRVYEDEAAYAC